MDIRTFILAFLFFVGVSGVAGTDVDDLTFVEQSARHDPASLSRTGEQALNEPVLETEINQVLPAPTIAAAPGD